MRSRPYTEVLTRSRERPHPGAQLRITDRDGWRITVFATNIRGPKLAELELQHRQRARAEDRIRVLKDTGLRNLPLHDFSVNQIWLQLGLLASDLLTWTQTLALTDSRPKVGAQTPAAATAARRRPARPHRPPPNTYGYPRLA